MRSKKNIEVADEEEEYQSRALVKCVGGGEGNDSKILGKLITEFSKAVMKAFAALLL